MARNFFPKFPTGKERKTEGNKRVVSFTRDFSRDFFFCSYSLCSMWWPNWVEVHAFFGFFVTTNIFFGCFTCKIKANLGDIYTFFCGFWFFGYIYTKEVKIN